MMKKILKNFDSLEPKFEELFLKKAPKLPKEIAQILVSLLYYLLILFIILTVISIFTSIPTLLFGATYQTMFNFYLPTQAYNTSRIFLTLLINFVFSIIYVYLSFKALSPIKERKMAGWKYLFYMNIFSLFQSALLFILNPFSFFSYLLGFLLAFYLLFQIKPYFK